MGATFLASPELVVPRLISAVPVLLAVVVVGGCAGGGGDPADAAPPITVEPIGRQSTTTVDPAKGPYVAAVNAICVEAGKQAAALPRPKEPTQVVDYLRQVQTLTLKFNAQIEALTPPAADRARIQKELLDANRTQAEVLARAIPEVEAAMASGDPMTAFNTGVRVQDELYTLVRAQMAFLRSYGLTDCLPS